MNLASALRSAGCDYQPVAFTRATWDNYFPGNVATSPLGAVSLSPASLDLPESYLLGVAHQAVTAPAVVVLRDDSQTFIRPLLVKGEVAGYAALEVRGDAGSLSVFDELPFLKALVDAEEATLIAMVDDVNNVNLSEFVCLSVRLGNRLTDDPIQLTKAGNGLTAPVLVDGQPESRLTTHRINGLRYALITDFGLAETLFGWNRDFLKADHGPIPPDARWITVHPHGEGSKGVPILIQPTPQGHFRVIGGAGGKLNMLKLRGVKSESAYRQEHAERASLKQQAHKEQVRRDKELGIHDSKQAARAQLKEQRDLARKEYVALVAQEMGWTDLTPKTDGLSPEAAARAESEFQAALFKRAKEAEELQRSVLVADKERRHEAGLDIIPLDPATGELSVQDLDPVRLADSSGISHNFGERAKAEGLDDQKLAEQVAGIEDKSPEDVAAAQAKKLERATVSAAIKAEIKDLPKPDFALKMAETEKAVKIIKARKKLKDLEAAVRKASKELETTTVEPQAFVAPVSEVSDEEVEKSLAEDLRVKSAVAFLAGVKQVGGEDAIEPHLLAGAHNAINAFSQAVGGASLIDRSVVDVLGVAAAAQVLARRIQTDYADKLEEITAGLEDYHVGTAPDRQQAALDAAADLQAQVAKLAPEGDLVVAAALSRQRRDHLMEARQTMGQALGEMEATASLIMSLRGGSKDEIQVSLGKTPLPSALQQLWALGLKREDYQIDRVAKNVFLTLKSSGLERLTTPIDTENLERVQRNLAIQRGAEDEADWLPAGFANRPDLALHLAPGVTASLATPFDAAATDLQSALRDFIGSRTADGHRAADILADVQSGSYFDRVGRPDEYRAALAAVIPTKKANGKLVRVEDLQPQFESYADAFVAKLGGDRSTLNKQTIPVDTVAQDALHRALSEEPAGVAAYKPMGDLTHEDMSALRGWFAENVAKESPEAAGLRAEAEQLAKQEPDRYEVDMFGDSVESPAWSAWEVAFDQAQSAHAAAGLTWSGYVKAMGSPQKARATIQDLIRSRVSSAFARHYNTLRPEGALKTGKTVVRNNLRHLDVIDPQAREQRLASHRQLISGLRERIKGQYASGTVNVDQALEDQAAFNQAQMGFFAAEDLPTTGGELGADERYTLGQAAENTIADMMGVVGKQFQPGKPVRLFQPVMSGSSGVDRQRAIKLIAANKRVVLGAGVGCVYGGTLLRCEITGREMSFYDWWLSGDIPVVKAMDAAGNVVLANASGPVFIKGFGEMFEVRLSSGASVIVTEGHRFYSDGQWKELASLSIGDNIAIQGDQVEARRHFLMDGIVSSLQSSRQEGDPCSSPVIGLAPSLPVSTRTELLSQQHVELSSVVALFLGAHQSMVDGEQTLSLSCLLQQAAPDHPPTIGEPCLSAHAGDGLSFCQTTQGYAENYCSYHHQYDEQLRLLLAGDQDVVPSQSDVLGRTHCGCCLGNLAYREECNPSCRWFSRHSMSGLDDHAGRPCSVAESHALSSVHGPFPRLSQERGQFATCLEGLRNTSCEEPLCQEMEGQSVLLGYAPRALQQLPQRQIACNQVPLPPLQSTPVLGKPESQGRDHISYLHSFSTSRIVEIVRRCNSIIYDIEIGEHHNYVANGILHHNSGKSAMMLGAISSLQTQGKISKSVIVCPSIVQGQMGGEALRFLEAGKFNWHCQPGASYEERLAAYKDPDTHFTVVTHQSFRDDLLKMAAAMSGDQPDAVAEKMAAMSQGERADFTKGVLAHHGIKFDFTAVDEGHNLLDREGKENSRMANVIGSVMDNSDYVVSATGDPVKNDASEIFSHLQRMDPQRYSDRDAFMRRYGGDTQAAKAGLQREMARHLFAFSLTPDVSVTRSEERIAPSPEQQQALNALDRRSSALRIANLTNQVDIANAKAMAPELFEGATDETAVAKLVAADAGIHRHNAVRRILDNHPQAAKIARVAALAGERKGKQGVVFARSLAAVESLRTRLEAEGHRVVTLTGADSAQQKAEKIRKFNPESGKPEADIIISSDAGATGANLQSGQWLVQYDCPDTAMTHGQRQGRINRIGQKNAVELIDLVSDHPDEHRARKRLAEKYQLRDLMTSRLDGMDDSGLGFYLAQRGFGAQKTGGGDDLFG